MIKKRDLYFPSEEFKKKAWLKSSKIYKEAGKNPVKFWEKLANELFWFTPLETSSQRTEKGKGAKFLTGMKKWDKVFDFQPRNFKWFVGGELNITANIFDQDFEQKKDKIALIWEPEPVEEEARVITYGELLKAVNRLANALKKLGVKKGDRVGIYLPMIPEVAIAMLACARVGAVHAVVFSAFSASALRVRLQDTEAKILITGDGYFRRGEVVDLKKNADEGIKETQVERMVVVKRTGNEVGWNDKRDVWYEELVKEESEVCEPEVMEAEDLFFILYTSGSTGRPKGTCHTCGGYMVQAYWTGKWIFDFHEDSIMWCTADCGWITGHTYGIYSPLLNGITTLIYEGVPDYPQADRWAKIVEKHKVTIFYTAPTAIRMLEKYGAEWVRKHKLPSLRLLGSVGEPIDEAAWEWYRQEVGKGRCPVVDTWWQTETGGILITSLPGIGPFRPAFTGLPFPGVKFEIFDEKGKPCQVGKEGNLVLLKPFAPGLLRGIYKNPKKYQETYWRQYGDEVYFTSDKALKDQDDLIRVVGRADDVIKVAGHRLTTGEMEEAINLHPDIIECAVVGIPDEIKGEVPVAFVISKVKRISEEIKEEVTAQLRKEIGPIATLKEVYLLEDLPKTRSGKIMRRILRNIFTGEELGDLSTLANPESVEKLKQLISTQ